MTGEVLGGGTQGNRRLENLQANLGPFANGLEDNTTVDEGLGEGAAVGS